jgi:hypothetical protein
MVVRMESDYYPEVWPAVIEVMMALQAFVQAFATSILELLVDLASAVLSLEVVEVRH